MKFCNKCNKLFDETMFHKNKASKDGLTSVCKTCKAVYDSEYRKQPENQKRSSEYFRAYNSKPENIKRAKELRELNRQQYLDYMKQYHQDVKNKQRDYQLRKQKYDSDLHYRLDVLMVSIFGQILSSRIKQSPTVEKYLHYTAKELRQHIELQFNANMNWKNYGEYWELDHIVPRNKFYYESYDDEQFRLCWSLDNLRPLEVIRNRRRNKV